MGRRKASDEAPIRGVNIVETKQGTQMFRLSYNFKGKRYRPYLNIPVTPNNIKAVNRKLEQIRLEIQMGTFEPDNHFESHSPAARAERKTIGELVLARMERKLKLKGKKGWDKSTYHERMKLYRNHIMPNFGHLTVQELTADHIRKWVSKQTFTLNYGQLIMSLLNPIVKEALADGVIDRHPYLHIQLSEYLDQPTIQEQKEKIDPLDELELHRFLDSITDPQEKNYFQFMFFTGLRLQEGPVVEWQDIDWHQRTLTVSRAVGLANNNEYLKSVKTNESRTIELNQLAWDAIMDQRQYTQLQGGYIFLPQNNLGTRPCAYPWLSHSRVRSIWKRLMKKAGIRMTNRSPKQTRHTYCSLMIAAGKPLTWVAQQAGHASLSMLERHYAKAVRLASHKHQDYDFSQAVEEAKTRAAKGENL